MTGTPGRKRRPTQSDVARHAGVSQAAVSQALNNSTAITIPAETRQRIMAAITELGYVPDEMARSLRSRKSRTIASIIPDITNPFYPAFTRILSIIAGLSRRAEQRGARARRFARQASAWSRG